MLSAPRLNVDLDPIRLVYLAATHSFPFVCKKEVLVLRERCGAVLMCIQHDAQGALL